MNAREPAAGLRRRLPGGIGRRAQQWQRGIARRTDKLEAESEPKRAQELGGVRCRPAQTSAAVAVAAVAAARTHARRARRPRTHASSSGALPPRQPHRSFILHRRDASEPASAARRASRPRGEGSDDASGSAWRPGENSSARFRRPIEHVGRCRTSRLRRRGRRDATRPSQIERRRHRDAGKSRGRRSGWRWSGFSI